MPEGGVQLVSAETFRSVFMLDIHVEEYRGMTGKNSPRKSNLFSRTNGFSFSDPENGSLRVSSATIDKHGIRIGRVLSTGHDIDLTELCHSTLLLPTHGRLEARSSMHEHNCRDGQALLFGPNKRITRTVSESDRQFEATVLLFPIDAVAKAVDRKALERAGNLLEAGLMVDRADTPSRPFLKFCDFLSSAAFGNSAAAGSSKHVRCMEALLLELYSELILRLAEKNGDKGPPSAGSRYVAKAEEYMRARLDEPLMVSEIAAAIGVSPRSLQLAFRHARSAAPREVLAMMRLHLVHEKLKTDRTPAGVTEIALECGVTNIGRFARTYHEAYGEKPSTTRRRARVSLMAGR